MSDEKARHEMHEDVESHETPMAALRMRLPSPLSPAAERAMTGTIGCAIAVHTALGPGFIETIYRKAMCVELESRGLRFELERPITVRYRDVSLTGQRVDLIVEGLIIVELKAVIRLDEVHRRQLISYLRTTGLRGGLLINFRTAILPRNGIKRVVL